MENPTTGHYIPIWLQHIQRLAEDIGPRGSTTESEQEALRYCDQVFRNLGLHPKTENFTSAKSIYHPHLLAAIFVLLAFAIYPLYGRISAAFAALLSILSISSQLLELSFRNNIFRRLVPKGESQNVFAVIPPRQEHQQDLVLVGHVDSHRTPFIFRSPTWVKVYQAFTTVAFVLLLAQSILYLLGSFTQWTWIWPTTIVSAICAVLLAVICIQADRTPFSAGANDNATAVGMVLTLAEQFQKEPLQNTRAWLICTGCEEVQHYGAIDFFRRHISELKNPVAVVFEMLGCAGPAWLTKEGIVIPFHADSELVRLAAQIAKEHPYLRAYPSKIKGGNTEMADALRAGIPAITLNGLGPNGEMPYWHQVQDTVDKMDPEVMRRAYQFTWLYLMTIDTLPVNTRDAHGSIIPSA
jgi:hypothetical protein